MDSNTYRSSRSTKNPTKPSNPTTPTSTTVTTIITNESLLDKLTAVSKIEKQPQHNLHEFLHDSRPLEVLINSYVPKSFLNFENSETSKLEEIVTLTQKFLDDPKELSQLQLLVFTWNFIPYELSSDELLMCAYLMISHVLTIPELQDVRLDQDNLLLFLLAIREAYHTHPFYHNFQHAVDVLQASFMIMLGANKIPHVPGVETSLYLRSEPRMPPEFLSSRNVLAVCLASLGHDTSHPGVSNAFLIRFKSPLAAIYNEKSVLESFHTTIYLRILDRFWPSLFLEEEEEQSDRGCISIRSLIVDMIISTDIGIHTKYMKKFHKMKLQVKNNWYGIQKSQKVRFMTHFLCLLIKCSDLSYITRPFDISLYWSNVLLLEQNDQKVTEEHMQSKLVSPPTYAAEKRTIRSEEEQSQLKGQVDFVDNFGAPLFQLLVHFLPSIKNQVHSIQENRKTWVAKLHSIS